MQTTENILMIRPAAFGFNEQTAENNYFQEEMASTGNLRQKAIDEFDHMVSVLEQNGIKVKVIEDSLNPGKPDAIFPNNWISFHGNGEIVLYPMFAENRRKERRKEIVEELSKTFNVKEIFDLSKYENENKFLEGTGSMVLERDHKICYACNSLRTDPFLLEKFCSHFGYKKILFTAKDHAGMLIYHTNVVMSVGEEFILVCMEAIENPDERNAIKKSTNKVIIEISLSQLHHFAGNMLEVKNKKGENVLVMSEQAHSSLLQDQLHALNKFAAIISVPLFTIETFGGGSARCMMAEIFLPKKD
ncbi:MAG: citrulline utilization hydrolase CtlX [Bacteroidia bacterium]